MPANGELTLRTRLDALKAWVAEMRAREQAATPGPWDVWGGPSYVGGGADLCIGAGESWLANMDHRNCVNREQHIRGGNVPPCHPEENTDICSTEGCRCSGECPVADHISAEQRSNADFIAHARTDLPCLLSLAEGLIEEAEKRLRSADVLSRTHPAWAKDAGDIISRLERAREGR